MERHVIGKVGEMPPGSRKILTVAGRSIGVFNVNGRYYALRNQCPHQGAPLCQGRLTGTLLPSAPGEYLWGMDGEILRCPWHGWEFDVTSGESVCNPHRVRVRSYDVAIEAEEEKDPSVESYVVRIEDAFVVVYV